MSTRHIQAHGLSSSSSTVWLRTIGLRGNACYSPDRSHAVVWCPPVYGKRSEHGGRYMLLRRRGASSFEVLVDGRCFWPRRSGVANNGTFGVVFWEAEAVPQPTLRILDADGAEVLEDVALPLLPRSFKLTGDGRHAAVLFKSRGNNAENKACRLWDLDAGRQVLAFRPLATGRETRIELEGEQILFKERDLPGAPAIRYSFDGELIDDHRFDTLEVPRCFPTSEGLTEAECWYVLGKLRELQARPFWQDAPAWGRMRAERLQAEVLAALGEVRMPGFGDAGRESSSSTSIQSSSNMFWRASDAQCVVSEARSELESRRSRTQ